MLARTRLGLFEAACGATTAKFGGSVYNKVAGYAEWSQLETQQAVAAIALGRFILGCLISNNNGEDKLSSYVSMQISGAVMRDCSSIMDQMDQPGFKPTIEFLNLTKNITSGKSARELVFVYTTLLSLVKNVTAGTIGYGILNYALGEDLFNIPLKQILIDAAVGVAAKSVGRVVVEDMIIRPGLR